MQADAYAGYEALYDSGKVTEVACWAHARRNFCELYPAQSSPIAQQALATIGRLYEIEARIRGKPPPHRQAIRQTETQPILAEFDGWLFAGSDAGGKRAANIYSLLGTARLHQVNPQSYLTYVLERIGDTKISDLDELLPWNVAPVLGAKTADR